MAISSSPAASRTSATSPRAEASLRAGVPRPLALLVDIQEPDMLGMIAARLKTTILR